MCALNGIFAYHSAAGMPVEAELLATREAMRARGPDGAGRWWTTDRRCGLAHRRLTILDLSDRAAQPMISEDGCLAVVFNGEIYNYPELRAELEARGVRFGTTSDTEVLLHLYARQGIEMVHRLRGMYAFAIWDGQRRGLALGRDPYGIKPLYTANDGWTFRFGSQVKALLAGGHISCDPEPAGHAGFYLFGSVPEPFTLYRDIRALPAGHTQWIDAAGPREPKRFANLAAILAVEGRRRASARDLNNVVRAAVSDSVRAHLLADVEVGAFLSGGVDSGALLGLMREAGQRDIRAITLAFEEFRNTDEDEAPPAARVAALYGAQHIVRRVGQRLRSTGSTPGSSRKRRARPVSRSQSLVSAATSFWPAIRASSTCRAGGGASARSPRSPDWGSSRGCSCVRSRAPQPRNLRCLACSNMPTAGRVPIYCAGDCSYRMN
jgi:asparagine synthase (glutamine-hydrolysing)